MTAINHIVQSCPLTKLATDGLVLSADGNVVIWLREVTVKAFAE